MIVENRACDKGGIGEWHQSENIVLTLRTGQPVRSRRTRRTGNSILERQRGCTNTVLTDQLLIHAQSPGSAAFVPFEVWNGTMHRWVRVFSIVVNCQTMIFLRNGGDEYRVSASLINMSVSGSKDYNQMLMGAAAGAICEEKTGGGKFITSYMCSPETAAEEFEMSKLIYESATRRSQSKEKDIIAYRIIQSFKPGEIMPEEANKIGYELAMRFTKGRHQFFVATHTDKAHIHNHIEFNCTNLECDGKFNNFKNSSIALRRLNDEICREHGCSVIENRGQGASNLRKKER